MSSYLLCDADCTAPASPEKAEVALQQVVLPQKHNQTSCHSKICIKSYLNAPCQLSDLQSATNIVHRSMCQFSSEFSTWTESTAGNSLDQSLSLEFVLLVVPVGIKNNYHQKIKTKCLQCINTKHTWRCLAELFPSCSVVKPFHVVHLWLHH